MQGKKGIIYRENGQSIFDLITDNSAVLEFSPWSTEQVKPNCVSKSEWERLGKMYTLFLAEMSCWFKGYLFRFMKNLQRPLLFQWQ